MAPAKHQYRDVLCRTFCTRDVAAAEEMRKDLEARLRLGIDPAPRSKVILGPDMLWEDFREQYRTVQLPALRPVSVVHAESRLDIAERIMRPRTLADMADSAALQRLQAELLAGVQSSTRSKRAHATVRSQMASVVAALNWAHLMGWLPIPPKYRRLRSPKSKGMKGRPISDAEFHRMLEVVPVVTGDVAAASWRYLMRCLWTSALRLGEAMSMSWDIPNTIRPMWPHGKLPLLHIPGAMQKNATDETIPLLSWFEAVLHETPDSDRHGWVVEPLSLNGRKKRQSGSDRPTTHWVGKVIAKIGREAGVLVDAADESAGRPAKYASAHDLRRSCGERMRESGVPPLVICRVMRHSSWETTQKHYAPGDIQNDAQVLRAVLAPRDLEGDAAE